MKHNTKITILTIIIFLSLFKLNLIIQDLTNTNEQLKTELNLTKEQYIEDIERYKINMQIKEEQIRIKNGLYKTYLNYYEKQLNQSRNYSNQINELKDELEITNYRLDRQIYKNKRLDLINESMIENKELRKILEKESRDVTIEDDYYYLYDMDYIKAHLSNINYGTYTYDTYDCDDFARQTIVELHKKMPGLPVGFAHVSDGDRHHAINIFLGMDKELYYIDYGNIDKLENLEQNLGYDKIEYIII